MVINQQNDTLGVVSLITGIVGVIFSFLPCCFYIGFILGVIALVFGILAKKQEQRYALAGIILGAVSIGLGLVVLFLGSSLFMLSLMAGAAG